MQYKICNTMLDMDLSGMFLLQTVLCFLSQITFCRLLRQMFYLNSCLAVQNFKMSLKKVFGKRFSHNNTEKSKRCCFSLAGLLKWFAIVRNPRASGLKCVDKFFLAAKCGLFVLVESSFNCYQMDGRSSSSHIVKRLSL